MGGRFYLILPLLIGGWFPAAANEATTIAPESKERHTLETYGATNAKCEEWSDGCAVCVRQEGERIACSLPGIACQPGSLACRREQNSPAREKTAK